MAYLTSEIALAQTPRPPSHTLGSHCPLLCTAILAVLSDIQQVQQIPECKCTPDSAQCLQRRSWKQSYCNEGSCCSLHKPGWQIQPAVHSHVGRRKLFKLRGRLSLDKTAAERRIYGQSHLSVSTNNSSIGLAWWYSARGACGAPVGHILMKSTQRTAHLRVMPCLESHFHVLANAEHVKQNCQLFNMNRRMYGVTWGVDRGRLSLGQIGGTTLMWVCGPAELSKVHWVICSNTPTSTPTPPLLRFSYPSLPVLRLSAPFMSCFVFPSDAHTPCLASSPLHTFINKPTRTHTRQNAHTVTWKHAPFVR